MASVGSGTCAVTTAGRLSGQWQVLLDSSQNCGKRELNLDHTLSNGQCFGWAQRPSSSVPVRDTDSATKSHGGPEAAPVWEGVVGTNIVWLQHEGDAVLCLAPALPSASSLLVATLQDYFQLSQSLSDMYGQWSAGGDVRMATICDRLPGMRIIRQPPWECLISFICSSNNNIGRITKMLASLRERFGTPLPLPATTAFTPAYAFPTVDALAAVPEAALRELGFGYRAPFVVRTAAAVQAQGGPQALLALRTASYTDALAQLMGYHGVGRKVADCVALFSLDQADAVPVDTHVWAIARRYFDPSLASGKSMTPTIYESVGKLFRERFTIKAGWAHSLLFAAELKAFQALLPVAMQEDMAALRVSEKEAKGAAKSEKSAASGGMGLKTNSMASAATSTIPSIEFAKAVPAKRRAGAGARAASTAITLESSNVTAIEAKALDKHAIAEAVGGKKREKAETTAVFAAREGSPVRSATGSRGSGLDVTAADLAHVVVPAPKRQCRSTAHTSLHA